MWAFNFWGVSKGRGQSTQRAGAAFVDVVAAAVTNATVVANVPPELGALRLRVVVARVWCVVMWRVLAGKRLLLVG